MCTNDLTKKRMLLNDVFIDSSDVERVKVVLHDGKSLEKSTTNGQTSEQLDACQLRASRMSIESVKIFQ